MWGQLIACRARRQQAADATRDVARNWEAKNAPRRNQNKAEGLLGPALHSGDHRSMARLLGGLFGSAHACIRQAIAGVSCLQRGILQFWLNRINCSPQACSPSSPSVLLFSSIGSCTTASSWPDGRSSPAAPIGVRDRRIPESPRSAPRPWPSERSPVSQLTRAGEQSAACDQGQSGQVQSLQRLHMFGPRVAAGCAHYFARRLGGIARVLTAG